MRQGKISKIIKNSEDIKENLETIAALDDKKISSFQDYFKAYQEDKEKNGFPLNARNFEEKLDKAVASVQDVDTAKNWYEIAKELDCLDLDCLDLDSSKLQSLSAKSAILILETAYDNLMQEEKIDEQEQQESHRQIQQQRR